MSDPEQELNAQKREMPEPKEGSRPIPWVVLIVVAAVFASAVAYLGMSKQVNDPSIGDHRTAADFVVAKGSSTGPADGAQIYAANCVACHQASGAGLPGVFPPLAGSEWVLGKPSVAVQIVLHGVDGSLTVKGNVYKGEMPTFKDKLSDKEIAAVLSHIRSSFGNKADQIDEALVKAQRAATKSHEKPWNGDAELASLK
ncbi:MAG: cytochrome c [Paralcaligenes sp.]